MQTLKMEFEQEKLNKMKAIYLKVGILSNIEPRQMHNAFDAYHLANAGHQKVALHIESVNIKIQCEVCNHLSEVKNYRFICERCERPCKNLVEGEEMLIHKVEFED